MGTHLLNFNMGSSLSYDVPPKKDLKKLGKSKVSREDLIRMKDRLRRIARREHGISRESFEEVASSVGLNNSKFVANWFDQFDPDGEEWFDFKMFAVYAALTARVKRRTVVEFCFRAYDKDSSGSLALDELTTLMLAVGRVIKQTNYALPGSVGKGSPSCDLSAKEERRIAKAATRLFNKLDKDDDDEISYREFAAGADRKEIRAVLDYFTAIANALPQAIDRSISFSSGLDEYLDNEGDSDQAPSKKKKNKSKSKKGSKKRVKTKAAKSKSKKTSKSKKGKKKSKK